MAIEIGGGITIGGGISVVNEGGGGGGTTFSDPTAFSSWILGDNDGTGYIRFQGPFNGSGYDPLGTAFYNFMGTVSPGDPFSVVAVDNSTTYNLSATVDNLAVYQSNQIDLYYVTVSGDLPFSYGGTSLSITFT
jgi:hypothetical protein